MYHFASVNETQKQKTIYFIPRITQNHKLMADKETSIFHLKALRNLQHLW